MRVAALTIGAALAIALIPACRHDTAEPESAYVEPGPPRAAKPAPLPPLSDELAASLNGRTIFIDPGHGGPFTGMIAPSNGVRETDVNLRVALNVRDRLEQHGAAVLMSREGDTAPIPDNLSQDLAARAAMSNEARPDIFLSIHHNADVEAGSQKDDLEVYYKLGDSMASLDLGRCLIASLGRGVRFDAAEKRLLPGNYKVLRLNDAPSLLLETAYLTNDRDAAYLATPQGIDDEARSIVYGVATYFAMDPPKLAAASHGLHPDNGTPLRIRFTAGLPIDLSTVTVTRDGARIGAEFITTDDGFLWYPRKPLPNGVNTLIITGRNMRGAGFRTEQAVQLNRPPATMHLTQQPDPVGPGNEMRFDVRVFDAFGYPVADGTTVTETSTGRTAAAEDGIARFYFGDDNPPASVGFTAGGLSQTANIRPGDRAFQTGVIEDALKDEPIAGAVALNANGYIDTADRAGWIALPLEAGPLRITKDGYEDMRFTPTNSGHVNLKMTPRHGGVLLGKRIAIDPAHGGRIPGARAPDGTRASDINLDAAQRLAAMLKDSGADVFVTRDGDDEITDLHRITETEAFTADLLLVISFGAPVEEIRPLDPVGHVRRDLTAFVGHYPQSINGIRAASAIGDELGVPITACVSYMVQQSQSAAVHVQPAALDIPTPNHAPFDATAVREIAEAIRRGIVAYFAELDEDQ